MSAKRIAERNGVYRCPVAAKLVEIIDVVNVDLRPDEDAPFYINIQASADMHLKMT